MEAEATGSVLLRPDRVEQCQRSARRSKPGGGRASERSREAFALPTAWVWAER